MNKHAKSWRPGDVVSACGGQLTGKVVQFGKAVKVQYGTPRKWDWPDGWVLGVGSREHHCLDCGQPYRSDGLRAGFCPACRRDQDAAHGDGGGRRSTSGPAPTAAARFYDRYRPKPEPVDEAAAARQRDEDEKASPF